MTMKLRPHDNIQQVFNNLFCVTGTNIMTHDGQRLQYSCNMIIARHQGALTLINTMRLDEQGLKALDALGTVQHIIRLGAFHDRHDGFYLDRYPNAHFLAMHGMQHAHQHPVDCELNTGCALPIPDCDFVAFETSRFPEGVLFLRQEGGVLITCDSIKNWIEPDVFFDSQTARGFEEQGFFGKATLSRIWLEATGVQAADFDKLLSLPFMHLLSAHGAPLIGEAHEALTATVHTTFTRNQEQ